MDNDDIEIIDGLGQTQTRIRFRGPLQGREVVWDAELQTLACGERSYIEVGEATADGLRALRIGLPVKCFDLPTLRKVVMMVRQYKRLRPGRHEYGEAQASTAPGGGD